MKYNAQLSNLIEQFMSKDAQWHTAYTTDLLFYVWEHYVDYWPDGVRIQFLIDGNINEYRMSLGPSIETILRHRRKIKSDHNKRVTAEGVGIFWDEDTKELEEETKQNFI